MTANDRGIPMARRSSGRERLLERGLIYAGATFLALFVLVPIYLIAVSAFTPRENAFDFPRSVVPSELSLDTILFFLNASGVIDSFWRSVIVALITLALSLAIGAPAGYALARYAFRGREGYRLVVLSTRAFPIVILAIPLAVTYRAWGINDTVIGVALMHTALALPFTVLITSSVFVSVPARKLSSNWLGVITSAAGTTSSRMNSGIPGRTKKPRPTSPITGSQK